jgi:hypothetical protein
MLSELYPTSGESIIFVHEVDSSLCLFKTFNFICFKPVTPLLLTSPKLSLACIIDAAFKMHAYRDIKAHKVTTAISAINIR